MTNHLQRTRKNELQQMIESKIIEMNDRLSSCIDLTGTDDDDDDNDDNAITTLLKTTEKRTIARAATPTSTATSVATGSTTEDSGEDSDASITSSEQTSTARRPGLRQRGAQMRRPGLRPRKISITPLLPTSPTTIFVEEKSNQKKRKRPSSVLDPVVDPSDGLKDREKFKVIILGAGISGLACARELVERNHDVVILEARNRPGGRLKSVPLSLAPRVVNDPESYNNNSRTAQHPLDQRHDFFNKPSPPIGSSTKPEFCLVDMGGAFIHGIEKNPIHDLCKRIGISTSHGIEGDECLLLEYENAGWPVSVENDSKVQKRFNYVLEQAFEMSKTIIELSRESETTLNSSIEGITSNVKHEKTHNVKEETNPEQTKTDRQRIDLPLPKEANYSTSFGSLFRYIATNGEIDSMKHDTTFQKQGFTGGYPINSTEACLFQWHVANLEMSCGASLDSLGLTWNDDEQYGFDGAHVLLKEGFGCMVESLADGLNIEYGMEVTGVRIVCLEDTNKSEIEARTQSVGKGKKVLDYSDHTEVTDQHLCSIHGSPRCSKGDYACGRMNNGHCNGDQMYRGTYDAKADTTKEKPTVKFEGKELFSKVEVKTRSGLILEADAVVCTLPLGILNLPPSEAGHVTFDPPLPKRKQNAISSLGFGKYNKCALSFPFIFWNSRDDFIGVIGSPVAGTNILFCNVSVIHDLPAIVIIFGGPYADYMENLTDETVVNECMDVLKRVWGRSMKKGSVYSSNTADNGIPNPIDYAVTRWGKDRYARGAFSFVPPGVDGSLQLRIMGEPIYDPFRKPSNTVNNHKILSSSLEVCTEDATIRSTLDVKADRPLILFAGEATTQFHPSTIHGAYLSGIREAYRLDLSLCPELNNNMIFRETDLYERTFGLSKRLRPLSQMDKEVNEPCKGTTRSRNSSRKSKLLVETLELKENSNDKYSGEGYQSHGVHKSIRKSSRLSSGKTLYYGDENMEEDTSYDVKGARHQPITKVGMNADSNSYSPAENVAVLRGVHKPIRKSSRLSSGKTLYYGDENMKEDTSCDAKGARHQPITKFGMNTDSNSYSPAENVAVLRGVDSFGCDNMGLKLVKSHMFPVPKLINNFDMPCKQRTIHSLQSRYNDLLSAGADGNKSVTPEGFKNSNRQFADMWSRWIAPHQSVKWWSSFEDKLAIISPTPHKPKANGIRKSSRKAIPKIIFDL